MLIKYSYVFKSTSLAEYFKFQKLFSEMFGLCNNDMQWNFVKKYYKKPWYLSRYSDYNTGWKTQGSNPTSSKDVFLFKETSRLAMASTLTPV